jgi:predicted nucleotidyltransferase
MHILTPSIISQVLSEDPRVVFAYLYGSFVVDSKARDVDIAIYSINEADPFLLTADLKGALYKETGVSADRFDVRVINDILKHGDLFGLLFLKRLFSTGILLVDRNSPEKGDFIERYGMKYRQCEGLIKELLS